MTWKNHKSLKKERHVTEKQQIEKTKANTNQGEQTHNNLNDEKHRPYQIPGVKSVAPEG